MVNMQRMPNGEYVTDSMSDLVDVAKQLVKQLSLIEDHLSAIVDSLNNIDYRLTRMRNGTYWGAESD